MRKFGEHPKDGKGLQRVSAALRKRSDIRCNEAHAMNTSAAGESPCPNCGWPICEHPLHHSAAATSQGVNNER